MTCIDYHSLYKEDLPHLRFWTKQIIKFARSHENVSVFSMPYMGVSRVINYTAYLLKKEVDLNVIYLTHIGNPISLISDKLSADKFNLLIEPSYCKLSVEDQREIESLIMRNSHLLNIIVGGQASLISNIEENKYFNTKFLENIVILRPLDYDLTISLINSRMTLDKIEVPSSLLETIYELGGGHGGLTKQIVLFFNKYKSLEISKLLLDPTIKIMCNAILSETKCYTDKVKADLGLFKAEGKYFAELLNVYKSELQEKRSSLTVKQAKLLSYLKSRMGETVSREEIEEMLFNENDYSMWGVYKFISRFREAISAEYDLINVYNQGYILKEN
jgi:hypothetical protein